MPSRLVQFDYADDTELDEHGNISDGATMHRYRREITSEGVRVTVDDREVGEETGEHGAGT